MNVSLDTVTDLDRLLSTRQPETQSLEFKEMLPFASKSERVEVLKDLTGMANGGGGALVYGIRESGDEWPVAEAITPISDRGVVPAVENVVRDGVQPPLLMDYRFISSGDGFVLVVYVQPSPLGPYMVEAYGARRYYVRAMTSTVPMSERQVRDAYTLATRGRESRPELWDDHALPVAPPDGNQPWLTVSALPEEPLREVLDIATLNPTDALAAPPPLSGHLQAMGLNVALSSVQRWADGFFGDDGHGDRAPSAMFRFHRDAAAAFAINLHDRIVPIREARSLNAMLAYLGMLWERFSVRGPVEMRIRVEGLDGATLHTGALFAQEITVREPTGVPVHHVSFSEYVSPWDLLKASVRHSLVQRVTDRLYQAFGLRSAEAVFVTGQLYDRDGEPLGLSIAGNAIREDTGTVRALVHDDGLITTPSVKAVGIFDGGVVIDEQGDALAMVELAPGIACPDNFLAARLLSDPRAKVPAGDPGQPFPADQATGLGSRPTPTGQASEKTLGDVLDDV